MNLILEVRSAQAAMLYASRHVFGQDGGTIGRDADNTWVLPDPGVSGHHARISWREGVFYIEDTGSTNHVYLNGQQLPTGIHALSSRDTIRIDQFEIRVSIASDEREGPPANPEPSSPRIPDWTVDVSNPLALDDDPFAPRPDAPSDWEAAEESPGGPAVDPLLLLNLPTPRTPAPSARDLGRGSPMDAHFEPPARVPAAPAPPAPVPAPGAMIPDDYDPLSDALLAGEPRPSDLQVEFSAYFPSVLRPSSWTSVVVYAHVPAARRQVQHDSRHFFDGEPSPDVSRARARTLIREGAEIQIVPWLPDCEFNPPRASISWREEWHRVVFRVRAQASEESSRVGAVRFYVGPLLVAELSLWPTVMDVDASAGEPPTMRSRAATYQAVFVSYCRDDAAIVDQLQHAYSVLGLSYIRDVATLRSGEKWNEAILAKIPAADIFQLCWSHQAKTSRFVEQEWRHALALRRPQFIRPVYWEQPMPAPPPDLADLHFARLHWLQQVA